MGGEGAMAPTQRLAAAKQNYMAALDFGAPWQIAECHKEYERWLSVVAGGSVGSEQPKED